MSLMPVTGAHTVHGKQAVWLQYSCCPCQHMHKWAKKWTAKIWRQQCHGQSMIDGQATQRKAT